MSDFLTGLFCQRCEERLHWMREEWRVEVSLDADGYVGGVRMHAFCIRCGNQYDGYVAVGKRPEQWTEVSELGKQTVARETMLRPPLAVREQEELP